MESAIAGVFLKSSTTRLVNLSGHIETCLNRLTDEQIWTRGGSHENAVGNLVLHLCGNARQWIVSGVGGAPDIRQRDSEFAAKGNWTRAELVAHLKEIISEAAAVVNELTPERLTEMITPQGYTVPVLDAIYQVVTHFHMHTGQIIFATKILCGEDLGLFRPLKP